jgi:hypothetical protein
VLDEKGRATAFDSDVIDCCDLQEPYSSISSHFFITPTTPSHNSKVVEEWGNWPE